MTDALSRRDALKGLTVLLGAAGVGGTLGPAAAADMPHLDPKDPNAVALAYHDDAVQVNAQQYPSFKSGQRCETCLQLQGEQGQAWRACNLFPGELVNAHGWCRVWVPKI